MVNALEKAHKAVSVLVLPRPRKVPRQWQVEKAAAGGKAPPWKRTDCL